MQLNTSSRICVRSIGRHSARLAAARASRVENRRRETCAHLGPDRWALAYTAGRRTSIDSLMKDIDRVLRSRARS
jgi:hypothetical protein